MRLLLSSHAFPPSIGGLERAGQLLAEAFSAAGHQVTVVTASAGADPAWDAADRKSTRLNSSHRT